MQPIGTPAPTEPYARQQDDISRRGGQTNSGNQGCDVIDHRVGGVGLPRHGGVHAPDERRAPRGRCIRHEADNRRLGPFACGAGGDATGGGATGRGDGADTLVSQPAMRRLNRSTSASARLPVVSATNDPIASPRVATSRFVMGGVPADTDMKPVSLACFIPSCRHAALMQINGALPPRRSALRKRSCAVARPQQFRRVQRDCERLQRRCRRSAARSWYRHADGSFGLFCRNAAGSQPWSDQRLAAPIVVSSRHR
jgi:hypothetical protein